ncbi:aminotransferase class III-fold pyridoxal phosphate-dependent enzyme [Rhodococcus sp. ABRD24]|uniref:aminotransferase class III-fold pyridoxal phosphate-dependent enzyme n=1 Tax=Rhodococcus sp. ABRD24 TaxID=2507582 RepID=UPI00103AD1C1|nr:aminotransferase class III-fold pyridoxal phosphate-dependent enzyme [Rhodococcus sp. ABRD24]QBJ97221.1 aminotransferase class III-fold pyridoxal phosphate-dependent enzyme [Rhodococcus sp. ABRD24]
MTDTLQPAVHTPIPGPKSQAIHARRTAVVPAGIPWNLPVYIDRAVGAYLIDVDGNAFVDMGSGIGVTSIGHANQAVIDAVTEQIGRFTHTLFGILPYEGYVTVAEHLARTTPGTHPKKTLLVNSGSEAVENAVKIARKHTGRTGIAVLDHAFHGRTNLTITMNHKMTPYGLGFGPFASDVHHVPNSYPYRDRLSGVAAAHRAIDHIEQRIGASALAALIVEPIQGEGGFIVPADGYLPALQDWANANGVVFIADEIQSGMGRTGAWFASEHFGITPDIVLTAKAIAAGLPLAGVTGRAEIMDSVHVGGIGGTFGGNPVAVAAAAAVFDEIDRAGLLAEADRIGSRLRTGLDALQRRHPTVGEVRGIGAMQAFELTDPNTGLPLAGAAGTISRYAAGRGVILVTAGSDGNVVRLLPNFTTPDAEIDYTLEVLDAALADIAQGGNGR